MFLFFVGLISVKNISLSPIAFLKTAKEITQVMRNNKKMSDSKTDSSKHELIKVFFQSCKTGIRSFKAIQPKKWLEAKGLNYDDVQIGFSSGQFSHRKSDAFKQSYVPVGILTPSKAPVREPHLKAYTCFGTYAIVFPLKDEQGCIVNLYAIGLKAKQKEEYLNSAGLYPCYPHPFTKRLYITNDVLSSATLLQAKVLKNEDAVLALFNGELKPQHLEAISKLSHLQEIIFIK